MLAEQRHARILNMVASNGSASVPELAAALDTSESTVRRDLEKLDQAGKLAKVHGGATRLAGASVTRDLALPERFGLNAPEKRQVAAFAATLVGPDDFVYVDSGSTTGALLDSLAETRATYVTCSVTHAMRLVEKGCRVIVLGGELKGVTDALVGPDALDALQRYHFSLGFWGTNGATPEEGLTTPDRSEAMVKRVSLERCDRPYVLCDATKFGVVASVTFAGFDAATILTESAPEAYRAYDNVVEVTA